METHFKFKAIYGGVIMFSYETCRENLNKLKEWYANKKGTRNEATTRLQLIDSIIFECLGWKREDVICEESHGKEFADYTFYSPRRTLIIEAKKEGDYFEIPSGKNDLYYSLNGLMRDNKNLNQAIIQVAGYCQKRGVPIGAVSNGHQLVIFLATRNDGVSPFDGKALVFSSFNIMLNNFFVLWQAISKPGINDKNFLHSIIGEEKPEIPPKLSASIHNYPGIKGRNVFQTDLKIVSDLVLEDLTRAEELELKFLEDCYCQSGALSQYSLMSKSILQARYDSLFSSDASWPTTVPVAKKKKISKELLAESLSRRPILLIGDVGVGKTTFIRHLINIDAKSLFEDAITLYLDFGSQATLQMDIRAFVIDEITKQLREKYDVDIEERNFIKGIYHSDLKRFSNGIYKDLIEINPTLFREKQLNFLEEKLNNKEQHLKKSLEHILNARKKQIVLFIDNADQRNDETQQAAFLISQEISEHWSVTVFVALRPETFHRSMQSGALSGYHPKAFTISPPRIDRVIKKRLEFGLKITSGEISLQSLPKEIGIRLSQLEILIKVFLDSLSFNKDLMEFIDNITSGNVRLGLDLVKNFFGSGHVDTEKCINIYKDTGSYYIPLHEFIRAIIYGDSIYYNSEVSLITNIFDVANNDPKEHFLLSLIIGYLSSLSSYQESGFVDTLKVYERLQNFGYTPEQIDYAIIKGIRNKLLETSAHIIPDLRLGFPELIRATTIGLYYIKRFCSLFSYIDAIIVDTPILCDSFREKILNVSTIQERLERAEIFRNYLNSKWVLLKDKSTFFDWFIVSEKLKSEIEKIKGKLS